MPVASRTRRHLVAALTLLSLAALPKMQLKETSAEDMEAHVSSVRLTVGNQMITISSAGTVTGGPITITRPTAAPISALFLNAAGAQDSVAHGGNFQLNSTPADATVLTFTRSAAFAGPLTGVAAGSTNLSVSLFHVTALDNDFGPFPVPVVVN